MEQVNSQSYIKKIDELQKKIYDLEAVEDDLISRKLFRMAKNVKAVREVLEAFVNDADEQIERRRKMWKRLDIQSRRKIS